MAFRNLDVNKQIVPTTTSANVALGTFMACCPRMVEVVNSTGSIVYIAFGTSGVAAVASTSLPVNVGERIEVFVGNDVTHAAAILASGSVTLPVNFQIVTNRSA